MGTLTGQRHLKNVRRSKLEGGKSNARRPFSVSGNSIEMKNIDHGKRFNYPKEIPLVTILFRKMVQFPANTD